MSSGWPCRSSRTASWSIRASALAQRRADAADAHHRRNPQLGGRSPVTVQHENCNYRPAHGGQDLSVHDPHRRARSGAHRHRMEARAGVAKVPDARLDGAGDDSSSRRRSRTPRSSISTCPSISKEISARPRLPGQPARGGCLRARAARVRERHRAARKGLGRSGARSRRRRDRADPQRSGGGRKAHGARREGPQEDQESRSSTANSSCWSAARRRSKTNQPLREHGDLDAEDEKRIRGFQFLSQKPMLYVLNLGEDDAGRLHEVEEEYRDRHARGARRHRRRPRSAARSKPSWPSCPPRKQEYLASYGLKESGLERLITAHLFAARPDVLPHGRRDRSARLDDSHEQHGVKAAGAIHSRLREEVHPGRSGELEGAGRSRRLPRAPRKGLAAAGRQGIHCQGWRRAGDPALVEHDPAITLRSRLDRLGRGQGQEGQTRAWLSRVRAGWLDRRTSRVGHDAVASRLADRPQTRRQPRGVFALVG